MNLLLAILKMLGTAAAQGAMGLGKAAVTGAKAGTGKLLSAFGGMGGEGRNLAQAQGILPTETGSLQEQSNVLNPMGQMTIPPQYLNMAQPPQQPIQPTGKYPGVFAGLKEGLLGMPSTAGEPQPSERGRQTAYYAGKFIPDIMRSKMGVSTTGEEARKQQQLETISGKLPSPQYKKDLQEAVTRLANPNLTEADKVIIYQQLVTIYPERSAEIKRIFFPQSQDNFDELLKGIIAGSVYAR